MSRRWFEETDFLQAIDSVYFEELYSRYLDNPGDLDKTICQYFDGLEQNKQDFLQSIHAPLEILSAAQSRRGRASVSVDVSTATDNPEQERRSVAAAALLYAYRSYGHLGAKLNPLQSVKGEVPALLQPAFYSLTEQDMSMPVAAVASQFGDGKSATLSQLVTQLSQIYCGNLGYEYMHISCPERRVWWQKRIEDNNSAFVCDKEKQRKIFDSVAQAVLFENFLHTKYVGAKRFGLDGLEAVIPALKMMVENSSQSGIQKIVFGMAHRGRLNVLTNLLGKPYYAIFGEFAGKTFSNNPIKGTGDVKYHMGFSHLAVTETGEEIVLELLPNPSHLEAVNPVVLGMVRACQDIVPEDQKSAFLPILIHGDAAAAGQGIVAECYAMSGLPAYDVQGCLHIVLNNQIGFTTNYNDARATEYASDWAHLSKIPIIHVNADDPEAVVRAVQLAFDYRQTFQSDVVVDIIGYRRYGHNEGDEPAFTQPVMYKTIRSHPSLLKLYQENLVAQGTLDAEQASAIIEEHKTVLNRNFDRLNAPDIPLVNDGGYDGDWQDIAITGTEDIILSEANQPATAVDKQELITLGSKLYDIDNGILHKTVARTIQQRRDMLSEKQPIDWATAEVLAFASLNKQGVDIRFSGQDVERGTFSQRHACVVEQDTQISVNLLQRLAPDGVNVGIFNSFLSEYAVLGFEYGYSWAKPQSLVLWEAQFGDFVNGAQIIIDQFIASAEMKWGRRSGLVMLLPHAYEGQGPEHSSARLERFLQLCAQNNMIVANCSTPASYFHALRRQIIGRERKPLILMTPKSLLRNKACTSSLDELAGQSAFQPVLISFDVNPKSVKRVILCSGKVYYDLLSALQTQDESMRLSVQLVRLEQLYPLPKPDLEAVICQYQGAEFIWCQEEPANMGAWSYISGFWPELISSLDKSVPLHYAGRTRAAATATGWMDMHKAEQESLVAEALGIKLT